ncbi:MAG TPA: class I SAM-dependent methyltransferase [Gemmatimonadales bacterium]|nr:class I SAM-dependent methyltransferase [Gemmatimonadales bacterium]
MRSRLKALFGRLIRLSPRAHRAVRRVVHRWPFARAVLRQFGLGTPPFRPRASLLKQLPPLSVGAEIGVHLGDFSAEILRIVTPTRLHLIDPWKYESGPEYRAMLYGGQLQFGQAEMDDRYAEVMWRFRKERDQGQVSVHRGASSIVSQEFPDGYFDWVYIDGNHLYEFVKQDLECFLPKVKVGGYLTGDDYVEGRREVAAVRRAVTEFLHTQSVHLVAIEEDQFILKRTA